MKRNSGFTLIELLVVIAVIGLLASVVLGSLNSARAKSRDARRIQDMQQIVTALELYYSTNGYYPQSECGWDCNGYRYSADSSWDTLAADLAPYIKKLPIDPKNSGGSPWYDGGYTYAYGNVGRTTNAHQYDLTAQFETAHPLRCAVKNYYFYFNNSSTWCGSYSSQLYEASPQ